MTYNPALWASGRTAVAGSTGYTVPRVETYITTPTIATTTPPDPEEGWPDPFMSYPRESQGIYLEGVDGATISYKSFEDIWRSDPVGRPIFLNNCNNITIERIDTRGCTMGLLYAYQCSNITVRYCRVENYAYEFIDQILRWTEAQAGVPGYFMNENDCNVFQINGGDQIHVSDLKAKFGNNEDAFSFYDVTNSSATRVEYEGCIADNRPTSDGRRSTYWSSASGTAYILGDSPGTGGHDLTVTDSSFIDPGQVGIAVACGYNNYFDNNVVIGTGSPPAAALNTPAYCYPAADGCTEIHDNLFYNNRGWYANLNDAYMPDGFGTVQVNNNWVDGSLNVEDYRVTL